MSFIRDNARSILAVLGFMSAIFAPSWVTLMLMTALAFRYRAPEVLAIGLFTDFLWLSPVAGGIAVPLFTIAALVLVWGLEPLRNEFLIAR